MGDVSGDIPISILPLFFYDNYKTNSIINIGYYGPIQRIFDVYGDYEEVSITCNYFGNYILGHYTDMKYRRFRGYSSKKGYIRPYKDKTSIINIEYIKLEELMKNNDPIDFLIRNEIILQCGRRWKVYWKE